MSWFFKKFFVIYTLLFCVAFVLPVLNGCDSSAGADNQSGEPSSSTVRTPSLELLYPSTFEPDDKEYPYVGIPRVVIETKKRQSVKDRETEVPAKMQIWGDTAAESEIMDLTIKGRGNSTWWYPKRPYAIKFEKKQSLLGMPKGKKWVLLANYRDRTLVRNAFAFEIARQTDIGWTPQGRFVEVFLNSSFMGNYYLCEKVEIQENRLNLGAEDYLLEFDTYYDGDEKFKSEKKKLPINIKSPKLLSENSFSYIQSFVDTVENVLYTDKFESVDLENYIDFKSFALYWIVYELTRNGEPNHPKSVYMHKMGNGPLKMGPVWDFDFATFGFGKSFQLQNAIWFDSLMKRSEFKEQVKLQWQQNKEKFYHLTSFVDSLCMYIKESNERNIALWPIEIENYPAGDEEMDFESSIERIKENYINEFNVMDSLILKM